MILHIHKQRYKIFKITHLFNDGNFLSRNTYFWFLQEEINNYIILVDSA